MSELVYLLTALPQSALDQHLVYCCIHDIALKRFNLYIQSISVCDSITFRHEIFGENLFTLGLFMIRIISGHKKNTMLRPKTYGIKHRMSYKKQLNC